MTERQALIAQKQAMQAARNRVRQLEGVEVLTLFRLEEDPVLERRVQSHWHAFLNAEPVSCLDCRASGEETARWLLENLGLSEGGSYYWQTGSVWAALRILDLPAAIRSLWEERDVLLVTADLRWMLGAGFDSRDEEHFLIDRMELLP